MLKRTTICALILLAVCAFFAVEKANAQQVWGSTDVIIDTNLRRIYGYHATEVDFIAWQYYEPLVEGFIYDQFGNELDFDSDVNHTGFTAEAFTESSYQPGRTFYVISDHYVGLLVPAPSPEGGGPAYWNPFGFGFSGPGGFFDFWGFGPGSPGFVVVQYIYLGSTGWELEFFGEPRIDQISPTSAPLDSNIELHFEGVNLGGNPTVNISGSGVTTGQIIFSTETRLSLNISISANAPTGNRSVTISTRGYTSNAVTFHIGDRSPHIDSINPSRGNAGSLVDVTLNGTNFGVNPILIITGGITGQVLSSTNTQINSRFTIPSSTLAGDYEVRVFSNGISGTGFINPGSGSATSNAVTFTVNATAAPRITDFAPKSGQLGTTVEVNVVGENFGTSRTLVIGGQGVTVQSYTSVSDPDHQIVATLNIAANAEVGDHSLRVSSGGQLSNSVNFRVGDPSPVISSINPSSGTAGTTFPVVITGSGFGSDPTVAVSGTGVSVTINQKSNTNIQATFQIASTAEAVLRQVTVTSRGVNGNGFTQTPGTNQSATHPFDIKKAEIKINSWDKQFAPSVERLNITYTIGPAGTVAPHARLEILKKGDKTNPVFVDNNIPKTGTVQYRGADGNLGWDGKDNNGNFIGPEGSPYTIRISIDDNSNFTNKKNATEEFKVEMFVEATMPPVPPKPGKTPVGTSAKEYSVIKPWNPTNPATELDTEITLKVLYLSKAGNNVKVGVALPYKVEWSFTDPDDTSSEREIDLSPNGGNGGDDNTLKDKNGKRPGPGQTSTMWKSSGFNFVLGGQGQTATSDIQTTAGPDQGSTKIKFSSSAVGGDNYLLKAVVKDASRVVHTVDFEKWSVRKALDFSNAYKMNGGADPKEYITTDLVKGAFEGEGYTDYQLLGTVQAFPGPSPSPSDHFVPLSPPTSAETPTQQELAAYAGPPGPAQIQAKSDITDKAQAWYKRNLIEISNAHVNAVNSLNPTAAVIIGARAQHPKYDGVKGDGRPSNAAKFYPDGIVIHDVDSNGNVLPNSSPMDPNLDWTQPPGDTKDPPGISGIEFDHPIAGGTIIKVAFIYKTLRPSSDPVIRQFFEDRKKIVGRHEIGHASDHVLFAPAGVTDPRETDHFTSGLMHRTADMKVTPTSLSAGDPEFAKDSLSRLRGRKR